MLLLIFVCLCSVCYRLNRYNRQIELSTIHIHAHAQLKKQQQSFQTHKRKRSQFKSNYFSWRVSFEDWQWKSAQRREYNTKTLFRLQWMQWLFCLALYYFVAILSFCICFSFSLGRRCRRLPRSLNWNIYVKMYVLRVVYMSVCDRERKREKETPVECIEWMCVCVCQCMWNVVL